MSSQRSTFTATLVLLIVGGCFVLIALERTGLVPQLHSAVTVLYTWTIVLAAFALLLGVFNVLLLHLRRIYAGQRDWIGSVLLVVSLLAVLLAGLFDTRGEASAVVAWLFDTLLAPGQAMLFALLAFFTAAAAYRYLRVGQTGGAWMLAGALLMFMAQLPGIATYLPTSISKTISDLLTEPVTAIVRGVLIGSSLALLIVGARFFLGRNDVG